MIYFNRMIKKKIAEKLDLIYRAIIRLKTSNTVHNDTGWLQNAAGNLLSLPRSYNVIPFLDFDCYISFYKEKSFYPFKKRRRDLRVVDPFWFYE